MEKIKKMQVKALNDLCEGLNKRSVAAKFLEKDRILTVLLPEKVRDEDIFCDIYFLEPDERTKDYSFFCIRAEIADVSKLEDEALLQLCVDIAVLNDTLDLGGYGVSLSEDGAHLKTLGYSVTVPVTGSVKEDAMTKLMDKTLSYVQQVISGTADELF